MQKLNAVLPNDWLHYLGNHRIFDVTHADLQSTQQLLKGTDPYDTFACQYQTRVMLLRGSDLIVAVGSEIRMLNISNVKDAWINVAPTFIDTGKDAQEDQSWLLQVPYKTLSTSGIDFPIQSMAINQSGNLLSVAGRSKLAIVCLPQQGFSHSTKYLPKGRIDCKTFIVGRYYYNTSVRVLKMAWHPLSETRTHIMVLSTDNILRMFDVSGNIDEAEQTFDLAPAHAKDKSSMGPVRGIILDDDLDSDEDVVTFTLGGKSEEGMNWEPFTVYYALRNGHLYALCPVLPYKSVIDHQHMETLACVVEAKTQQLVEEINNDDDSDAKALYYLLRLQSQWISDVIGSGRKSKAAMVGGSDIVSICSRDSSVPFPVQRQGPFKIQDNNQLVADSQVGDLIFISTQAANILVAAYTNGHVQSYLLGSEIDPQWLMPVQSRESDWKYELGQFLSCADILPKASIFETIQLRNQPGYGTHNISIIPDHLYKEIIYVYHAGGVHRINMTKLITGLSDLERLDASGVDPKTFYTALQDWHAKDNTSECTCLIESNATGASTTEPIIGMAIITDIYLTYSMLALTGSYKLVPHELSLRQDAISTPSATRDSPEPTLGNKDQDGTESLLEGPLYTPSVPQSSQTKIVVPQEYAGKKEVVISEDSLRFLSTSTETLARNINQVNKGTVAAKRRLQLQEREMQRQTDTIRDLYQRLDDLFSVESQNNFNERILETARNHGKLALRIDSILRQAMGRFHPGMSTQEKEWAESLDDLQKQVEGDQGYTARINKLQEQLTALNLATTTQLSSTPLTRSKIDPTQLDSLQNALDKQAESVKETKARITALQRVA
ncbi:hypothetical protein K492DRAFT_208027 [Lichtheimia hyalospora FSU 10163]|nr:hypothetical protein K492DRAFT_208027 [Lichtheimia hyalospora FSU 10163]